MQLFATALSTWWTVVVVVALCLMIAGSQLGLWAQSTRQKQVLRKRFRKARRGEEKAAKLLAKHGFEIVEAQAVLEASLTVDGEEHSYKVVADFIVTRDDSAGVSRRFVAEVKTGDAAPEPTHRATRRQLLEYLHLFGPDGLLLVDMQQGAIRQITFQPSSLLGRQSKSAASLIWAWSFAAGCAAGAFLTDWLTH